MSFVKPNFKSNAVNRAGDILCTPGASVEDFLWAFEVLANWRASHGYPINTFQATLRSRLKRIDKKGIVAERLKRTPSILLKLNRFNTMKLSRMQDIGGLRAIVRGMQQVRMLEKKYREGRLDHKLVNSKDYISNPKADGYRCVHLVFRYYNDRAPQYNGLHVELQIRTKLQHAWATAVETMGTFLGQALKSGMGDDVWRRFFSVVSAGFAKIEETAPVPGYESLGFISI